MAIEKVISFLVYPGKNVKKVNPPMGVEIELNGSLFNLLNEVYEKSDSECNIPIRFLSQDEKNQFNEMRLLIINFLKNRDSTNGEKIASRLSDFTNQIPGLALLFLIYGNENNYQKFVISRFPADQGILAETSNGGLSVQYIEKIFMKNLKSYKAALYIGRSFDADFWKGNIVDKQLKNRINDVALYWIKDFLLSDFETTSSAGSMRIGIALREVSKNTKDFQIKQELISAAVLLKGYSGQMISLQSVAEDMHFSENTKDELIKHLKNPQLFNDSFDFDYLEFLKHAPLTRIELDNGGIMMAPSDRFNDCFPRETISSDDALYRFSTEGRIVNEMIRGR
ncbi:MAG: hypothetical protein HPY72_05800 [Anaerolineae bacterium]|nr:hypothetical protein [Anaerolineae bacterium]